MNEIQKIDRLGQVFGNGRYKITRSLDAGGMGAVFVAEDRNLNGYEVVIKFPHENLLHQPEIRKRFQQEVNLLIELSRLNRHIVQIQDVGEENGMPYAVMQYLGGGSLREWKPPTPNPPAPQEWTKAFQWLGHIANALDFVHQRDLIHRDVKPQNILFGQSGDAYLADFGISKPSVNNQQESDDGPVCTEPGLILGTLPYMSYELLRNYPATGKVDQHALAVTVYEVLANGKRPFATTRGPAGLAADLEKREYKWLHQVNPAISKDAAAVIDRAMATSPDDRYPTCTDFADDFLAKVCSVGVVENRSPAPPPPPPRDEAKTRPPEPPPPPPAPEAGPGKIRYNNLKCPWCWNEFSPGDLLWVAVHSDLFGDSKIKNAPKRFLPERFNSSCQAIDPMGRVCSQKACPHCHLLIPQTLVDFQPLFVSVIGNPSAGKSCFLAAMSWEARKLFPSKFKLSFTDSDTGLNQQLIANEELLFAHESEDRVRLKKTELQGDDFGYQVVNFAGHEVSYLRPFIFEIGPNSQHVNYQAADQISVGLCIYDNAGEHFQSGQDRPDRPVTRHLIRSDAMIFVYDPAQDREFARLCRDETTDTQFDSGYYPASRQELLIVEARNRLRRHGVLRSNEKYDRPVIVLVNKYDAWAAKFGLKRLRPVWTGDDPSSAAALDGRAIAYTSSKLRELLLEINPDVVATLDNFASKVVYMPSSSFGRRVDAPSGVRANSLKPMWCEAPLLYILSQTRRGLVQTK